MPDICYFSLSSLEGSTVTYPWAVQVLVSIRCFLPRCWLLQQIQFENLSRRQRPRRFSLSSWQGHANLVVLHLPQKKLSVAPVWLPNTGMTTLTPALHLKLPNITVYNTSAMQHEVRWHDFSVLLWR